MPAWLSGVLDRIHKLAKAGKVRLTVKALAEVRGLGLGLGVADVSDVLMALAPSIGDGASYVRMQLGRRLRRLYSLSGGGHVARLRKALDPGAPRLRRP